MEPYLSGTLEQLQKLIPILSEMGMTNCYFLMKIAAFGGLNGISQS